MAAQVFSYDALKLRQIGQIRLRIRELEVSMLDYPGHYGPLKVLDLLSEDALYALSRDYRQGLIDQLKWVLRTIFEVAP